MLRRCIPWGAWAVFAVILLWGRGNCFAEEIESGFSREVHEAVSPVGGRFVFWDGWRGCAQSSDGRVHCWGRQEAPRTVMGLRFPVQVKGNGDSLCFLDRKSRVGCVGGVAALLTNEEPEGHELRPVWLSQGVRSFAFGYGEETAHLCIVRQSGEVACLGHNEHGQLGDGTRLSRSVFAPVLHEGKALRGIKSLDLSAERSCAVAFNGELYCWGRNEPGDQAREYHGPKRYLTASLVPLEFKVAAMGASCLVAANRQEYCWPIVDEATQKVSYRPLARSRCDLEAEVVASFCVRQRGGKLSCDHGEQRVTRSLSRDATVYQSWNSVCIAEGARAHCFTRRAELHDMKLLGFMPEDSASQTCQGEAPQDDLPLFPAHPFEKVVVVPLRPGLVREPGLALDAPQVEMLREIASSAKTYSNVSTCHNPSLLFNFIDEGGEVVGQMSGWGCPTLAISPSAPASFFAQGNVVTPWAKKRMKRVENSL